MLKVKKQPKLEKYAPFSRWPPGGLCIAAIMVVVLLTIVGQPTSVDAEQRNAEGTTDGSGRIDLASSMTLDGARSICGDMKVKIEQVSQMKKFIYIVVQLDSNICPERYFSSVVELDGLLKIKTGRLCEPKSIDAIRDYHFRFISPKREIRANIEMGQTSVPVKIIREQLHPEPSSYKIQFDEFDQTLMIPITLRHFFLKWVLQISAQCKRDLLNNLASDGTQLQLEEDDKALMELFDKESPLGGLLAQDMDVINFENAVYMPDWEGKRKDMKDSDLDNGRKVHIKSTGGQDSSLFELVNACQLRFKPIYEQLIMPIIKLGKLGYDYLGDRLTADELAKLSGPKVKSWLGIVHVCEMFDKVLVVEKIDKQKCYNEPQTVSHSGDEANKQTDEPTDDEAAEDESQAVEVSQMSNDEVDKLKTDNESLVYPLEPKPMEYKASERCRLAEGELWIKSRRQLDLELSRKPGNKSPFGFSGLLRRTRRAIRRELAKLDFKRFAHYRRHSNWYSGVLNFISSCSNVASITVTLVFTIPCLAALGR